MVRKKELVVYNERRDIILGNKSYISFGCYLKNKNIGYW